MIKKHPIAMKKENDNSIFWVVMSLLLFGLVMISSAGIVYSQTRFGDQYYFLKRQFLFGVIPGLIALYFFQKIDYRRWKKFAVPFFLFSLLLLILIFIPGLGANVYGATRWLDLGPISFQPSELAKLSLVLYLAAWLESRGKKTEDMHEGLLPFLGVVSLVGFLIMKQPDMGTMGVVVLTSLVVFFAAGAKISHLFSIFILGVTSFFALLKSAPYRMDRFMVFLNPELDPKGIGYQINQALLAIGTGGIMGAGLGHSRQKFNYLPEPVGDSIFAVVGEELGFIGATLLVILFAVFAYKGLKIAKNAPDEFGKLLAIGIVSWITIQAFVNIAAITAIIPLTGIPLPFISYGGTALAIVLSGVGILLNISKNSHN